MLGCRITQRITQAVLVLADEPEENSARQLVLEADARDVRDGRRAAVARAHKLLVEHRRGHPNLRRRSEVEGGAHVEPLGLGGLEVLGVAAVRRVDVRRPFLKLRRLDPCLPLQRGHAAAGRVFDRVAAEAIGPQAVIFDVGVRVELVGRERGRHAHAPSAAQRSGRRERYPCFSGRTAIEEPAVRPEGLSAEVPHHLLDRRPATAEPAVPLVEVGLDDVVAAHKPSLRSELFGEGADRVTESIVASRPVETRLPQAADSRTVARVGHTAPVLERGVVHAAEHEPPVQRGNAIRTATFFAVGQYEPKCGLRAEIAPNAHDVEQWVVGSRDAVFFAIHRRQHGDVGGSELPDQFCRPDRTHDVPRVHQLARRVEILAAFDEERSQFGEEEGEPHVAGQLSGIGFDLREVGPHRPVERHVGTQAPSYIAAELLCRGVAVIRGVRNRR